LTAAGARASSLLRQEELVSFRVGDGGVDGAVLRLLGRVDDAAAAARDLRRRAGDVLDIVLTRELALPSVDRALMRSSVVDIRLFAGSPVSRIE